MALFTLGCSLGVSVSPLIAAGTASISGTQLLTIDQLKGLVSQHKITTAQFNLLKIDLNRVAADKALVSADQQKLATIQGQLTSAQLKIKANQEKLSAAQLKVAADQEKLRADQDRFATDETKLGLSGTSANDGGITRS
jgi:hypothetical protein